MLGDMATGFFLEFLSHTIFEIEEWRTIKWEVILDILVISNSFCFIFVVTATDNKKIYNNSPFNPTRLPTYHLRYLWDNL